MKITGITYTPEANPRISGTSAMRICSARHNFNYDWHRLFESYRAVVRSQDRVLEIGASTIDRTEQLARLCSHVTGVELFPDRMPRNRANIEYVCGDWQTLTSVVQPETIDVAVSSHVIEHVPDDARALRELHAVLKPGGIALLNTPNRGRLTRRCIECFTGPRQFPWWEHQREYVERDLHDLVAKTPFTTYSIEPVVFGIHGGPVFAYLESVPRMFRQLANYWQVTLRKAGPPSPPRIGA
jgi:SAM-dependent methyltransferase